MASSLAVSATIFFWRSVLRCFAIRSAILRRAVSLCPTALLPEPEREVSAVTPDRLLPTAPSRRPGTEPEPRQAHLPRTGRRQSGGRAVCARTGVHGSFPQTLAAG